MDQLGVQMDQLTEELSVAILKAREKWIEENLKSPQDLAAKVSDHLDRQVNTILGQLLGFDSRYGNWEVDHCNGRGGESLVGNFIKEIAGKEAAGWLLDKMVPLPELTKPQIKALRNDFSKRYEEKVRDELRGLIEKKAKEDAQRIFEAAIRIGEVRSLSPPARETVGVADPNGSDSI